METRQITKSVKDLPYETRDINEGMTSEIMDMSQELAQSLFDPENIQLKTEYHNVYAITGLEIYAEYLKSIGLTLASERAMQYFQYVSENSLSSGRKSRQEGVDIVRALRQAPETTMLDEQAKGGIDIK